MVIFELIHRSHDRLTKHSHILDECLKLANVECKWASVSVIPSSMNAIVSFRYCLEKPANISKIMPKHRFVHGLNFLQIVKYYLLQVTGHRISYTLSLFKKLRKGKLHLCKYRISFHKTSDQILTTDRCFYKN